MDLRAPALQQLYQDWDVRRRGRPLPSRADFDALELNYVLGHLSLIDVLYEPLRFRYRVYATEFARRVGFELTGKMVDDIPHPEQRAAARRKFEEAVKRRIPLLDLYKERLLDGLRWNLEVLILPLSSDGEIVDKLFCGLVLTNDEE